MADSINRKDQTDSGQKDFACNTLLMTMEVKILIMILFNTKSFV